MENINNQSENSRKGYIMSITIIGILFFIFGFVTWLNGTLIPFLKISCELNNTQAYLVTFSFYISYFVMALPSSWVLHKTGFKGGMALGLAIMGAGTLFFLPAAWTRTYGLFLTGLFIQGTGLSLLQTASNPYITILGPIESAAKRISIMGICNKVAGVISPLILGAIVLKNVDPIKVRLAAITDMAEKSTLLNEMAARVVFPYIVMSIALFILAILVRLSPLPDIDTDKEDEHINEPLSENNKQRTSIFQFPNLMLGFIAIFLYVGVEVIAGDTIILYGQSKGIAMSEARIFTSYTLISMVIGYIIGIITIPRAIKQDKALGISAVLGLFFALTALSTAGFTSVLFIAFLGFANAVMWPAIWPLALKGLGKFTKTGSAILIMGIAGGATLPLLYGRLVDIKSIGSQHAYWILIPCYLYIFYYAYAGHKVKLKAKKSAILILCTLLSYSAFSQNTNNEPKRKTRAESFFGLHFDFHAQANDSLIGKTLTKGMLDSLLIAVKPDFIQVDCKGHPGYCSYPTKVGNRTKGYKQDVLKLIREVTAKHGVALYVHYSGVLDGRALELHPNWARIDEKGVASKMETSRHSAYADSLLIPQLKELAGVYNVDGAWIDGECWALHNDYSAKAVHLFSVETGIEKAPLTSSDKGWSEWMNFTRNSFKQYLRKYIDAIHKYKPGFQITSNWSYTGFMPEPVDVNIDFISGDFSPQNSVYSAAFEARCISPQGKPWDLMSWGFGFNFSNSFNSPKSSVQLKQEAAEVISIGGGFQIYFTQNRDASIKPWVVPLVADVSDFCRQRREFCMNSVNLPEIALLYSSYAFIKYSKNIYYEGDGITDELRGNMMSLLNKQYCVQILMEHHLKNRIGEFPLIVIPGWQELSADFKAQLVEYVNKGGKLLLIGPGPAELFIKETGITVKKKHEESIINLGYKGQICAIKSDYAEVLPPSNAKNLGGFYEKQDLRFESVPAASIINYGKGTIAVIYANLGNTYINQRTSLAATFLSDIVNQLLPVPSVRIEGSENIHVNLTAKNGKKYLHLINTNGQHDNEKVYEWTDITPLHNITVHLKTDKKPTAITLQPEGYKLNFTFKNGLTDFVVPEIGIYSIVQIE